MSSRAEELEPYRTVWTRVIGPAAVGSARERIVLAPPTLEVSAALGRLRNELTRAGGPIRLIALGATIEERWPAWLSELRRPLLLTELDVYLPRHKAQPCAALMPQLAAWLDEVLEGVTPGVAPSDSFWASAYERLFLDHVEAWLLARTLAEVHRDDELTCLDPGWSGWRMLAVLRAAERGETAPERRLGSLRRLLDALRLVPLVGAAETAGLARRAWQFARERKVRAQVRAARALEQAPEVWMAVVGSWPRASRPVVDMVPLVAREAGKRLGVLLLHSLEPGLQQTAFSSRREAGPLLPTLRLPQLDGLVVAVDQGVSAESGGALVRAFLESLALSARATVRALGKPAVFGEGAERIELALPLPGLAKLLTLDVLQAREGYHAARALLGRRDFAGRRVIYPHLTALNDALLARLIARQGGTTIELVHGLIDVGHHLGPGRTVAQVRAMWSLPEAAVVGRHSSGQECLGGFFPRPLPKEIRREPPRPGEPIHILIGSSYLVTAWGLDPRLYEHYQRPLLSAAVAARRLGFPLELRWRPHPGDDPRLIAKMLAAHPEITRSTGSLDEDFAWSHVIVTSVSSIIMEALFQRLPVLIHEVPRWDDAALFEELPAERLFGLRQTLEQALLPVLRQLVAGDPRLLDPERALAERLLGPGPRSVSELLWPDPTPAAAMVSGGNRPANERRPIPGTPIGMTRGAKTL